MYSMVSGNSIVSSKQFKKASLFIPTTFIPFTSSGTTGYAVSIFLSDKYKVLSGYTTYIKFSSSTILKCIEYLFIFLFVMMLSFSSCSIYS